MEATADRVRVRTDDLLEVLQLVPDDNPNMHYHSIDGRYVREHAHKGGSRSHRHGELSEWEYGTR